MTYSIMPIFVFLAIFLSTCHKLDAWITTMKEELKTKDFDFIAKTLFQDTLRFNDALKMSMDLFSSSIFFISIASLILKVSLFYRAISFFITGTEGSLGMSIFAIGYIFYLLYAMCITFILNRTSQLFQDNLNLYISQLRDLIIPESILGKVNGQNISSQRARMLVIDNLREFEGFHGLGYFRLGKTIVTGIMANFTAYLIVLLQVKVSEL